MHFLAFACGCTRAERALIPPIGSESRLFRHSPGRGTVASVKSVAWSLLGFCTVVSAVAFVHLLSPDVQDSPSAFVGAGSAAVGAASGAAGPEATTGGVLSSLTATGWADAVVALVFAAVAFAFGSYLTARAAADADTDDAPVPEFA